MTESARDWYGGRRWTAASPGKSSGHARSDTETTGPGSAAASRSSDAESTPEIPARTGGRLRLLLVPEADPSGADRGRPAGRRELVAGLLPALHAAVPPSDLGGSAIQYAETMASSVPGFLPLLAVFLLLQRQIVQGVANTGINKHAPGPGRLRGDGRKRAR